MFHERLSSTGRGAQNNPAAWSDPQETELAFLAHKGEPGDALLAAAFTQQYAARLSQLVQILAACQAGEMLEADQVGELVRRSLGRATAQVDQFRGEASLRNWIFSLAYQETLRYLHRKAWRRWIEVPPRQVSPAAWALPPTSHNQQISQLDLGHLPASQKLSLCLYYGLQLNSTDQAAILGVEASRQRGQYAAGMLSLVDQPGPAGFGDEMLACLEGSGEALPDLCSQVDRHLEAHPEDQPFARTLIAVDGVLTQALPLLFPALAALDNTSGELAEQVQQQAGDHRPRPGLRSLRLGAWVILGVLVFLVAGIVFMRAEPGNEALSPTETPVVSTLPAPLPMTLDAQDLRLSPVAARIQTQKMSDDGQHLVFTDLQFPMFTIPASLGLPVYAIDLADQSIRQIFADTSFNMVSQMGWSWAPPSISGDGRYILVDAIVEDQPNLPGTACITSMGQPCMDILLYDQTSEQVRRITHSWEGGAANGDSYNPVISAGGGWAAFWSEATNLEEGQASPCLDANPGLHCSDIYMVDLVNGAVIHLPVALKNAREQTNQLSLSADGRWLAYTSMSISDQGQISGAHVYLFDRFDGTITQLDQAMGGAAPSGIAYIAALSADGRYAAFTSRADNLVPDDTNANADVFVRDLQSGETKLISRNASGDVGNGDSGLLIYYDMGQNSLAITPDGRYIVYLSQAENLIEFGMGGCWHYTEAPCNGIYVYDQTTGVTEVIAHPRSDEFYQMPSISADGQRISFVTTTYQCEGRALCTEIMLYDRQTAWTTNLTNNYSGPEEMVYRWDEGQFPAPISGRVNTIEYSPDGNLLAVAGDEPEVVLYQAGGGQTFKRLAAREGGQLISVAVSPNNRLVAAGTDSGLVYVWDLQAEDIIFILHDHPGPVKRLIFSPESRRLYVLAAQEVWVWEASQERFTRLSQRSYPGSSINDIDLSPDGDLLAMARGNGMVWLLHAITGEVLAQLAGNGMGVADVAFSPSGNVLASRMQSGLINTWNISWEGFGAPVAWPRFSLELGEWSGNLVFSPDERSLVSGSGYLTGIAVVSLASGEARYYISQEPNWFITSLSFAPDGRTLAVGSWQGVSLWQANKPGLAEPFFFTIAEADQYPGLPPPSAASDIPGWGDLQLGDELQSLYQAEESLGREILIPAGLPEGAVFQEARLTSQGGVYLHYDLPGAIGEQASLFILEQPSNILQSGMMALGASAAVEKIQVNERVAEYVTGDWQRIQFFTPPSTEASLGTAQEQWFWDNNSPSQRMRWRQGDWLVGIYYQVHDTWTEILAAQPELSTVRVPQTVRFSMNAYLGREALVQLALLMQPLPATDAFQDLIINYRVQAGDTCIGIAQAFGTTTTELAALNGLGTSCDMIYAGQLLQVPVAGMQPQFSQADLDCDGLAERVATLPALSQGRDGLIYGIAVEHLSGIGTYTPIWRLLMDEVPGDTWQAPITFDTGGCQKLLAIETQEASGIGLRIVAWDANQAFVGLDITGRLVEPATLTGTVTQFTTRRDEYDPATGACWRILTPYAWNGEVFTPGEATSQASTACFTP